MKDMHINKVRHLIQEDEIQLVTKNIVEIGPCKIKWKHSGRTEIVFITKLLNL